MHLLHLLPVEVQHLEDNSHEIIKRPPERWPFYYMLFSVGKSKSINAALQISERFFPGYQSSQTDKTHCLIHSHQSAIH